MLKFSLLLCAVSSFVWCGYAQVSDPQKYYVQGNVPFKSGIYDFDQPLIGGFNSPEFLKMDLDNNGVDDLLVFDKGDGKMLPFLRTGSNLFQYAPKYEAYIPKAVFYCKTADLNSDGKMDFFTLNETRSLIIHKNITQPGDSFPRFQNLGEQVYRNQYDSTFFILFNAFSLSNTDLPEISDIDGDGDLDILTYDGSYQIYVLYEDVRADKGWSKDTFEFQKMDICWGYFTDFNNTITLGQCPYKLKLKMRHTEGAACFMFDNDEDGDKELVLSNFGQTAMTYLENGKKDLAHEYDTLIAWDSIFPRNTTRAADYQFPAGFLFDTDGDGVDDLITAPNLFSDGKETNQVWLYKNHGKNNKPDFKFVKDNFLSEKTMDFGARSVPAFCDADADGDLDLFLASNGDFEITGGIKDRIHFFENTGTSKSPYFELKQSDFMGLSASGISDMIIRFGDVDGDGDMDMLLGERMGRVFWFRNTAGAGNAVSFTLATTNLVGFNQYIGETNAAPVVYNYNNDSLPDLLVGYYHGAVILYENNGSIGNPSYTRIKANAWGMHANEWRSDVSVPGFVSYGYAVPEVVDIDQDSVQEIMLGTAFGGLRLYRPAGRSVYDSLSSDSTWIWQRSLNDSMPPDFGTRVAPTAGDLSGDGFPEIFFGGTRGGLMMATTAASKLGSVTFDPSPKVSFQVFPNPTDNMVFIGRNQTSEAWNIVIVDVLGRVVKTSAILRGETQIGISTNGIAPGVYSVNVVRNGLYAGSTKLLIQRN